MKHLVFFLILVMAQGVAFGAAAPTPTSGSFIPKTPTDKLNLRIRHQMAQVQREVKAGKLTKDQAKALRGQVETIRKAELADLKQNGTKTLNDSQISQLNGQLDTLSKSIPIR